MNETEKEIKDRDAVIAENESAKQTGSAIRVSVWAIAVAVLLGLGFFGWLLAMLAQDDRCFHGRGSSDAHPVCPRDGRGPRRRVGLVAQHGHDHRRVEDYHGRPCSS